MSLLAVQAVSRYCKAEGRHYHTKTTSDPRFNIVKQYVPWKDIAAKLAGLSHDDRDSLNKYGDVLSEIYRAPIMANRSWQEVKSTFKRDVLSKIRGPLRQLEEDNLEVMGPPLNTSWDEYYTDRFIPHYRPYRGVEDVNHLRDWYYRISDDLIKRNGGNRLQPYNVIDVQARRRVDSDLGFYYMRTMKSLDRWQRYMLFADTVEVLKWWDENPSEKWFAIVPGTRITAAALGSAAPDYNRVVMSVDSYAIVSSGRWSYPVLDAFRSYGPTLGIFGYRDVERYIQENPDMGYISLDTSRMDASVKYDPIGKLYTEFFVRTVAADPRIITSDIYSAHHPMVVTPGGIFFGPIGNASGKTDTTNENTLTSLALGNTFCDEEGIKEEDRKILGVGDDLFIAYKRKKYYIADGSEAVARHWAKYGFKAKKEKQEFSPDTALFLKRRFSRDPLVGSATMLLTNILNKMVWMQASQFSHLFASRWDDDNGVDFQEMALYLRVLASGETFSKRIRDKEKKAKEGKPPSYYISPPPNAKWPYFVPDYEAVARFNGWEGEDGPVSYEHIHRALTVRAWFSYLPDAKALYYLGVFQALGECITHPWFPEFIKWLAQMANLPHDVSWMSNLVELGHDRMPPYTANGGPGAILVAASLFIQERYGEIPIQMLSKVEVFLESAPDDVRSRVLPRLVGGYSITQAISTTRPASGENFNELLQAAAYEDVDEDGNDSS